MPIHQESRIRKAYSVTVRRHNGNHHYCEVYAPNASKARAQVISMVRDAWDCSFRDALQTVGCVARLPDRDVALPHRHPLAGSLSHKILHCVVHAYGGLGLKAGYRDHFYTSANDWVMRAALYHCLFHVLRVDKGRDGRPDMIMYELTDLGRNVAHGEQPTYPEH